jgi:outer membrane protein assembly factor BamC
MTGRLLLLLALGLCLGACGGTLDKRYLDANVAENLVIPPDLAEVEVDSAFELPSAFSGDDPAVRNRIPVLAKVESMHLEHQSGLYWLSVQEPVENLYQLVRNFWEAQGYRLLVDEPVIGIMQTEWIYKMEGSKNEGQTWWERLGATEDLSASQDQYRTRIERDEKNGLSRIYITHRGTEYKHVFEVGDNTLGDASVDWQFRRSEPELEVEMLSRLMVYLGLEKSQVDRQLVNAKLFEPRASLYFDVDEQSPYLIVNDPYHIAWNRVYHQLERLNFEIEAQEFSSGVFTEGYFIVVTETVNSDEDGGFFSSGSGEPEKRKIVLVLSEESHEYTRVEIENMDGDLDQSQEGSDFLKLIYRYLK